MKSTARIVVLANRLPVAHSRGADGGWTRSPGGLVTAMEPVVRTRGGIWIGWDGSSGRIAKPPRAPGVDLKRIRLTRSEVDAFYHGFCNSTIWPLYHDALFPPVFHRAWWEPYVRVNARFAGAAARVTTGRRMAWIHDYQLQLAPAMLRARRPSARIGFFLHIPFPPAELFAWLPWRTPIIRGLLGADVVAFQTPASAENFARAARRYAGAEGSDRELVSEGRAVRVLSCPISVPMSEFEEVAESRAVRKRAGEIRRQLSNRRVLLAVDRLDYTKGIPERLRAFEELLREGRISSASVVLVQIAVPSRDTVPGYEEIRRETEQTVGRINGVFSEPGKVAVHYFRRSLDREELVAYYRAADVMVVTPLRDGMNLVAKEFVASRTDRDGVLVLSEFAGAATELRKAIQVNAHDIDAIKSGVMRGLEMPADERRKRMLALRMAVRRHDVADWANEFLEELGGES